MKLARSAIVFLLLGAGVVHAEEPEDPTVLVPMQIVPAAVAPQQFAQLRLVQERRHDSRQLRYIEVPSSLLSPQMRPDTRLVLIELNDHALHTARATRNAGMALAVAGTALTLIGPFIAVYTPGDNDTALIGGFTLCGIGPLALLIGVPMWAVGGATSARRKRSRIVLTANGIVF